MIRILFLSLYIASFILLVIGCALWFVKGTYSVIIAAWLFTLLAVLFISYFTNTKYKKEFKKSKTPFDRSVKLLQSAWVKLIKYAGILSLLLLMLQLVLSHIQ